MELNKGIPVADRATEEIIESLDTCFVCGHSLKFTHKVDYKFLIVHEICQCPACGIKQRPQDFILQ
jgi:hypothetical protein